MRPVLARVPVFSFSNVPATVPAVAVVIDIMDTDDVLANLGWGLIRDWRRRRDVTPAVRWG
jgi:hypothetical protein